MSYATALRCRKCGREYPLEPLNLCDFCLSPLEVNYDYKSMAEVVSREKLAGGPLSMWRYRDMLPVEGEAVDIGTGFTRPVPLRSGQDSKYRPQALGKVRLRKCRSLPAAL